MRRTSPRAHVLAQVADLVPDGRDRVLVGVDGADAAGKTTFADELGRVLVDRGRPVVRLGLDDFHAPRSVRHRRGRRSPSGFYADAFDLERFRDWALLPLGPGGDGVHRLRALDLEQDAPVEDDWLVAPPGSVTVVDGLFLLRPELEQHWQLHVFLDVPVAERTRRMAQRDGTPDDPSHPELRRYHEAQRHYRRAVDPVRRAAVVVDNADPRHPRVRRPG